LGYRSVIADGSGKFDDLVSNEITVTTQASESEKINKSTGVIIRKISRRKSENEITE
jgi:hypothetical protein